MKHTGAPRPPRYQAPLRWNWFLRRMGYVRFMAREATSVLIALYLVYFLTWLFRLGQGPEAHAAMLEAARSPLIIALHVVAIIGALYHATTWFNLTPKIMPMYIGEDRVPDAVAAVLMGYAPWVAVSALIVWGVTR